MTNTTIHADLPHHLRQLLYRRQQHAHSITTIDGTMSRLMAALDGPAAATAVTTLIDRAGLTPRVRQTLKHLEFNVKSRAKLMALFCVDVAGMI